jgi:ketosteroid isomerase-like protein
MNEQIKREISELEDRRCKAMVEKDLDALGALLDDAMSYTHSSAVVDTKSSYIDAIRSGKFDYKRIERRDTEISVRGDLAIVTGGAHIDVAVNGADRTLNLRYSNVWIKTPQGWKFALWHACRVAEPA